MPNISFGNDTNQENIRKILFNLMISHTENNYIFA